MKTIKEVFSAVRAMLEQAGIAEAEAEAKEILAHACGLDYSGLRLRFLDGCDKEAQAMQYAQRRVEGRPLAYILGEKCFYGRDFFVDERVLVPRFDTECVAQAAIELVRQNGYETALDLCCGSGCIGVTLACECDLMAVHFTDISEGALKVTQANIDRLAGGCGMVCEVHQSDLFDQVSFAVDLIVCNPPYISEREFALLEAQVRDFEPPSALLAGDGYAFYRRLAPALRSHLTPGGSFVLEIGDGQFAGVEKLLIGAGFDKIHWACDLAGRRRAVYATLPAEI